jgi:hypothetical protein
MGTADSGAPRLAPLRRAEYDCGCTEPEVPLTAGCGRPFILRALSRSRAARFVEGDATEEFREAALGDGLEATESGLVLECVGCWELSWATIVMAVGRGVGFQYGLQAVAMVANAPEYPHGATPSSWVTLCEGCGGEGAVVV